MALKFLKYFWKKNVTPFEVARKFGKFSTSLFKQYVEKRFDSGSMSKEERHWLSKYLYQANMLKGSGEYGITTCFKAGLWAYNPLERRLNQEKFSKPITFIYGYQDWMDPTSAYLL